jgi:hypothetical protein
VKMCSPSQTAVDQKWEVKKVISEGSNRSMLAHEQVTILSLEGKPPSSFPLGSVSE